MYTVDLKWTHTLCSLYNSKLSNVVDLLVDFFIINIQSASKVQAFQERIQAFETKCLKKLLPHLLLGAQDRRQGEEQDQLPCGSTGRHFLLVTVKRRKLACSGHVASYDSLSETVLQGTLEEGRRRGRQSKCWVDNVRECTSLPMPELLTMACPRKVWKKIYAESFLVSFRRSSRSRDLTEQN